MALVTGGASGIGLATVQLLAQRGWRVAVADLVAEPVAGASEWDADSVHAVTMDVRDVASVRAGFEETVARWGSLDLVVNSAGVQRHASVASVSEEDWNFVVDVNVRGVLLCMQQAARHMLPARRGAVVNIASVAAARGPAGRPAYGVSKAAVVSLTMTAAAEWAPSGVRVNAVAPGYVDTPLLRDEVAAGNFALDAVLARTPLGRLAEPEEIARVIAFLGDAESSYVTGQVLYVDGGFTIDYGVPPTRIDLVPAELRGDDGANR